VDVAFARNIFDLRIAIEAMLARLAHATLEDMGDRAGEIHGAVDGAVEGGHGDSFVAAQHYTTPSLINQAAFPLGLKARRVAGAQALIKDFLPC